MRLPSATRSRHLAEPLCELPLAAPRIAGVRVIKHEVVVVGDLTGVVIATLTGRSDGNPFAAVHHGMERHLITLAWSSRHHIQAASRLVVPDR